MKVYCARPISGRPFDEVWNYYARLKKQLNKYGYEVLNPMTAKEGLKGEKSFVPGGYADPIANDHSIVERDCWMVKSSDVVYTNLFKATSVSIGCVAELAWAHLLGKHTIVVMDDLNPHQHAFVKEMADIIFDCEEKAIEYLEKLAKQ